MNLFLLLFFLLYGSIHLYAFIRLRRALHPAPVPNTLFILITAFATLSPIMVRIAENSGYDLLARLIAWPGYSWMGFIFILVAMLGIIDLLRLAVWLIVRKRRREMPEILSARLSLEMALLVSIAISCYGFYEARNISVEHVTIRSDKLSMPRVRVVQVSDVHLGLLIQEKRLQEMLEVINQARPDIFVSTGDLIDGRLSRKEDGEGFKQLEKMLSAVKAPAGKYAVLGNHEYYAGLGHAIEVTEAAGFRLLRNEYIKLQNGICISGVDDAAWKRTGDPPPAVEEQLLLKNLPPDCFRLHLKHRPVVKDTSMGLFDLQLSGHTHRGQIFPFYLLTKLQFPLPAGTTKLAHGSILHTSRGTGTWGPPIRFLAKPEVSVIDIIPKAKPD